MRKIEVDDQVYEALKCRAEAFVDSPNTVLRRVLDLDNPEAGAVTKSFKAAPVLNQRAKKEKAEIRSKQFVEDVLGSEFGRDFNRRGRFVYMLENKSLQIYFQNFNAS